MGRPSLLKPLDYLKRLLDRRCVGIRIDRQSPERVSQADLQVADVLFCCGGVPHIPWQIISHGSSGPYVHAAVYIGGGQVSEATTKGVLGTSVSDFVARYKYIAVTRCPGVHGDPALPTHVRTFCESHISSRTKYDFIGACLSPAYEILDLLYQRTTCRTISFNWPRSRTRTFCSQFVLDAFVSGGYIPSNYYALGARSPTALAEENFLDFIGYLSNEHSLLPLVKNDLFWSGGG